MPVTGPHALLAEFDSADALVAAARAVRAAGYTRVEAFAPYPLPAAGDALGYRRTGVPFLVLLGGAAGGAAGYFMQYWVSTEGYRLNVGGRPPHSWPMFVPITFELTVLTASFAAFLGMLVLCRLPRFHHPLFAAPRFARATTDGFFLAIETDDPKYDPTGTRQFLAGLHPAGVEEVPR